MSAKEWAITLGILCLSPFLVAFALVVAVWANLTHTTVHSNCGCMRCHFAAKMAQEQDESMEARMKRNCG